ncbi:MAG: 4Fe-4S binding protein [Planctomycetota bacterium]
MNTDIICQAIMLGLVQGPACTLHCSILVPAAAEASAVSALEGTRAVTRMFLGRFIGYLAAGLAAGFSGRFIDATLLTRVAPWVFLVFGTLFILYGLQKYPVLCRLGRGHGPFLLGLLTGIAPCPPFLTLGYAAIQAGEVVAAVTAFGVFFIMTSFFLVPLFLFPAVAATRFREYGQRLGLGLALLLGIYYCLAGMTALAGPPADAVAQAVDAPAIQVNEALAVRAAALEHATLIRNGTLAGFLVIAMAAYKLKVGRRVRYGIGLVSIVVIGLWLKATPGTIDILRLALPGTGMTISAVLGPLAILIATFIAGRVYCGFVCPAGMTFELLGLIGPGLAAGNRLHRILVGFKYAMLLAGGILAAMGINAIASIEPFGLFALIRTGGTVVLVFAGIFILTAILAGRVWCQYLCPIGALLALMSRNTLFPKKNVCKGCRNLRVWNHKEGDCLRCLGER